MGRHTQYNHLTSPEVLKQVNPANVKLKEDFLTYLKSIQRADSTIKSYASDLDIIFVYILKYCDNIPFQNMRKRNWIAFQQFCAETNGNSPARIRRLKATASSLSNFVVSVLQEDDEPGFENFKPTIKGIESPANIPVRTRDDLTDEDCQKLLNTLVEEKKYEQAAVCAVAMYSGRRKQELYRIKTSFFDDENLLYGALYKSPELVKTKGRSKGKFIHIFILKDAKPYVDMWLEARKAQGLGDSEWLFPDKADPTQHRDGSIMNSYTNHWSKIVGKEIFPHLFRHRFTSYLAEKGLPDDVIMAILQWSSAEMLKIYKHVNEDDLFSTYFSEDGIKAAEKKSLSDL